MKSQTPRLTLDAVIGLLTAIVALLALVPALPVVAQGPDSLGVQAFLETQPGPLKGYYEEGRSAAEIIESAALYYGLSPRLHLALLEATAALLTNPTPSADTLQRPFSRTGPAGFAAQIEWASRELRAGLGPYDRPPTLRFSDGVTLTLTLDQAPEGVAVQRFLAAGRTAAEWYAVVEDFQRAFVHFFDNTLIPIGMGGIGAETPEASIPSALGNFVLLQPWPAGVRVVHLAYFDHGYPTVDSGDDGNGIVINYLGHGHVQYDGHDGHDYCFPDQPIGTPILAAADGIAYARTHPDNGVVVVHPDGYETIYWHLGGFAPIFAGRINTSYGVPVAAGDMLGISGPSPRRGGTPHLHFEVRRYGKQVDPYGWYGVGPDPCAAYAGCLPSGWLWSPTLIGTYDFTPPDAAAVMFDQRLPQADRTPPTAAISVAPPANLLFAVSFDGHAVQHVGRGWPSISGAPRFIAGRAGQALASASAELIYPLEGNLNPHAGTLSLWIGVSTTDSPHTLLAVDDDSGDASRRPLTLWRDNGGPDGRPRWIFSTTADVARSEHQLTAPDSSGTGWRHVAVTWNADNGHKALYVDGKLAAEAKGADLPVELSGVLRLGQLAANEAQAGLALDDLQIYDRPLNADEIARLANAPPADSAAPVRLSERTVRIDTNAVDDQGGIVVVQFGINGTFSDPQPYYDAYRWTLPVGAGRHELAVRFTDRAGNTTTVTRHIVIEADHRLYLPLVR